jgi:hypothetical protein
MRRHQLNTKIIFINHNPRHGRPQTKQPKQNSQTGKKIMIIQVTESIFVNQFDAMDRGNQFSYQGLRTLFDYLTDMDADSSIELDVIALCCEFSEYDSLESFRDQYGEQYESIDDIAEKTTVIDIDGTRFIAGDF